MTSMYNGREIKDGKGMKVSSGLLLSGWEFFNERAGLRGKFRAVLLKMCFTNIA